MKKLMIFLVAFLFVGAVILADGRIYSKPQHWLICEARGYSELPPSVIQQFLKRFPLEAFATNLKCEDAAWIKNRMANQVGILCVCEYFKMDERKAREQVGAERMPK
jgi:hypothetical protein